METMRCAYVPKAGGPETIELRQIEKPVPGPGEILIQVKSATVTRGDVMLRKIPRIVTGTLGFFMGFKPMSIPGVEFSGIVRAVGSGVEGYGIDDEVCGTTTGLARGANAEFLCVPASPKHSVLTKKPESVSFDIAAAAAVGGMTAFQLLKKAGAGPGKKVLVYGASGSVGSAAVQLSKLFGCDTAAVCGPSNVSLIQELDISRVFDYIRESPFSTDTWDIIFDAVGKAPKKEAKTALNKDGAFTSIASPTKETVQVYREVLSYIAEGKLTVLIDKFFSLEEIQEAHRYVEKGHKRGNVIIHPEAAGAISV
ncbi:NAD(P)-dependent alcohol dehydrogenase [Marispirochaeta sp.]|jgi:NADPH:quinone reductase-like Zn-dependent oxidoreductase|uniref:NAD(P)-dependent alcohol dehydrogenase n=1 Tax=Marispirochaeta sp. TaxID=2038653 RepID=UPI0029C6614A|nr:NAD(P)-dependent alcohol dehydrogenase [Marispirochaeta sp.]